MICISVLSYPLHLMILTPVVAVAPRPTKAGEALRTIIRTTLGGLRENLEWWGGAGWGGVGRGGAVVERATSEVGGEEGWELLTNELISIDPFNPPTHEPTNPPTNPRTRAPTHLIGLVHPLEHIVCPMPSLRRRGMLIRMPCQALGTVRLLELGGRRSLLDA